MILSATQRPRSYEYCVIPNRLVSVAESWIGRDPERFNDNKSLLKRLVFYPSKVVGTSIAHFWINMLMSLSGKAR